MAVTSNRDPSLAFSSDGAWSSLSGLYNAGGSSASCSTSSGDHSIEVKGFGFSSSDIPSGVTILGVEVDIFRYENTSTNTLTDSAVHLVKGGGTWSPNNKAKATTWPSYFSAGYVTYGGPTDLWGFSSITLAEAYNSGFGVKCGVLQPFSNGASVGIDHVRMRIYYQGPVQHDLHVKDAGVWKQVDNLYVKDAGVWKDNTFHVRDAATWKQVYGAT